MDSDSSGDWKGLDKRIAFPTDPLRPPEGIIASLSQGPGSPQTEDLPGSGSGGNFQWPALAEAESGSGHVPEVPVTSWHGQAEAERPCYDQRWAVCGAGWDLRVLSSFPPLSPPPESEVCTLKSYCLPRFPKSGSKITSPQLPLNLGLSSEGAQDMAAMERKTLGPTWAQH